MLVPVCEVAHLRKNVNSSCCKRFGVGSVVDLGRERVSLEQVEPAERKSHVLNVHKVKNVPMSREISTLHTEKGPGTHHMFVSATVLFPTSPLVRSSSSKGAFSTSFVANSGES